MTLTKIIEEIENKLEEKVNRFIETAEKAKQQAYSSGFVSGQLNGLNQALVIIEKEGVASLKREIHKQENFIRKQREF